MPGGQEVVDRAVGGVPLLQGHRQLVPDARVQVREAVPKHGQPGVDPGMQRDGL